MRRMDGVKKDLRILGVVNWKQRDKSGMATESFRAECALIWNHAKMDLNASTGPGESRDGSETWLDDRYSFPRRG
jgi:hypothetical protein